MPHYNENTFGGNTMDEGSYGGGFLLGFFLSLVGLIIAIAIDKPATKKGAITGFIVQLVGGVLLYVCFVLGVFSSMYN